MKHLDLFSGIGGAALAVDDIFPGSEHLFCEIDPFCQQVLKKHFPNSYIHGDIRTLTTDPRSKKLGRLSKGKRKGIPASWESGVDILTGGFPCQPFSHAGRRKGTQDNRHLWPEMLRVIREFKPRWIIGENVAGLLSMVQYESGFELEDETYLTLSDATNRVQEIRASGRGRRSGRGVLSVIMDDLIGIGYDVQPFVIPAVAVNAPHRRDRVWIVANARSGGQSGEKERNEQQGRAEVVRTDDNDGERRSNKQNKIKEVSREGANASDSEGIDGGGNLRKLAGEDVKDEGSEKQGQEEIGQSSGGVVPASYRPGEGLERSERAKQSGDSGRLTSQNRGKSYSWDEDWAKVASELCRVDDGLSSRLVRLPNGEKISATSWRKEALKGYGNAWVPADAKEILKAIKTLEWKSY